MTDNDLTVTTPFDKLRTAPQLMLGIAVVLAIVAGLSGLFDQTSTEGAGPPRPPASSSLLAAWAESAPALAQEAKPGIRARARCAECGVIESSSDTDTLDELANANIESTPTAVSSRRWITVRLADGSRRLIDDTRPADWRLRERVVVIGGRGAD